MPVRRPERTPAAVYADLAPAVLGYFRAHRMPDPEGLTGDVFVAVTQKLGRFRGDDDAVRRWVFTIAHHRRVDAIRRATKRPDVTTAEVPVQASQDPEPLDPELVAALGALTDEQREVVVLRFVADLAIAEVARITRRSGAAVKMLQARGLESMERYLTQHPFDHEG